MKCPHCGNTDLTYFYHGSNGWYCRKCISFGRAMIEEELEKKELCPIQEGSEEYTLQYPLTQFQQEISKQCIQAIHNYDVLLKCVCGAGKTEMVVETIAYYLRQRKKVCFAIARRQVVLEVAQRLQQYFYQAKVIPVCQGYTKEVDGDLIVCTTHQLYRYPHSFDLLILDEPDAFPFRGNEVLHGIAKCSCIGHTIYLTATPDETLLQQVKAGTMKCFTLNARPHGKPIPVPKIVVGPFMILFIKMIQWLEQHDQHPRIVFVPTIVMASRMHMILSKLYSCYVCTSKSENKDEIIRQFKEERSGVIVATTVLERGVTIPHCDICVFEANHSIFDEAGLIQMAGRAGRSFQDPYGDVLFLCNEKSELCMKCQKELEEANQNALFIMS